ncbi:MAG: helix-turn-helix domain-containing protein [Cellvibrionaceae bacterium]
MAGAVGVRLKALREYYRWSQRELAKRAGVPNSAISVIEQGSVSPSVQSLEKVLKGFPLTLQNFFAIDTSITPAPPVKMLELEPGTLSQTIEEAAIEVVHNQSSADFPIKSITPQACGRLILLTGSANFFTVGADYAIEAGQSLVFNAGTPYRLEPTSPQCSWIVINLT